MDERTFLEIFELDKRAAEWIRDINQQNYSSFAVSASANNNFLSVQNHVFMAVYNIIVIKIVFPFFSAFFLVMIRHH